MRAVKTITLPAHVLLFALLFLTVLLFVNIFSEVKTRSVDKKNQLDVTFLFFICLLVVAQHVSGNHVPIIRS